MRADSSQEPERRPLCRAYQLYDAARAANRPILGVVLHLGNWEAMGVACLAIGYPVAALYVPEPNRFEERLRAKMQRHHGAVLIPPGFRAMRVAVRTLNERTGQFGIFIDEVFGGRQSAPASGRPLRAEGNIAFAARLAAWLTKAEIIPAYCLRIGDGPVKRVSEVTSGANLVKDRKTGMSDAITGVPTARASTTGNP